MTKKLNFYMELHEDEAQYKANLFNTVPILKNMLSDYEQMKDLTEEEKKVKAMFEIEYEKMRQKSEPGKQQYNEDYKDFQFEIQDQYEKLKDELIDYEDNYHIGFTHV